MGGGTVIAEGNLPPGSVYTIGTDIVDRRLALFLIQSQMNAGSGRIVRMQLAVESGAKRILIPSENKRDVADVPDAVLTAIQWQFYDSPTRAALLAMGLG